MKFSAVSRVRWGFLAAVLLAGPVAAAQQHTPLTDQQIQSQVEHRLSEKPLASVTVAVRNRVVTLTGIVANVWAKNETIEQARGIHDVESVVSEITIARGESDLATADEIAKRVRRYVFYTIFDDVSGTVSDGTVTLRGRVTMPYKAQEIAELASRVHGVQDVINEIGTLPVSTFDEQLRYAIAAGIYRDPLFWNYAIQVNPPIHVVVEHGRVTPPRSSGARPRSSRAAPSARSAWTTSCAPIGRVGNRLTGGGRAVPACA
jgi:hypothetical protein